MRDAVAVVEWAAEQEWCCGRVVVLGVSWSGFVALQVAASRAAPALAGIVAACASDDRYADDMHYQVRALDPLPANCPHCLASLPARSLQSQNNYIWTQRDKVAVCKPVSYVAHRLPSVARMHIESRCTALSRPFPYIRCTYITHIS